MIYWLCGQPGSGKTSIALELVKTLENRGLKVFHIDGDDLRHLTDNQDFSENGRRNNITLAQKIAKVASSKGMEVVVSVVSPYLDLRESFKKTNEVTEIWVHTSDIRGRENYFVENFEKPVTNYIDVDTTGKVAKDLVSLILPPHTGLTRYIQKADKQTSQTKDKYAMYIGRWQPWHQGHRWLIDQSLNQGKQVLICIRQVAVSDKNPFSDAEVLANIEKELADLIAMGRVKVIIIPDIESVNYGRGVGYDLIEYIPPEDIHNISATKIRAKMLEDLALQNNKLG